MTFWDTLPKPFLCLAPMDGATDAVFRQVVVKAGKPDVLFTEFTSVEGMIHPKNRSAFERLEFKDNEHPIVAQIWGYTPELFYTAAQKLVSLGFDGIDINMGCPVRDIMKKRSGSACINDPNFAAEVIYATKEGIESKTKATSRTVALSVKTRIGINTIVTEEWCGFLLEQGLDALIVHGRTAKELSKVPCHWDEIGKVVKLRNQKQLTTKIIGNGDVLDREMAGEYQKDFDVDGVMIGRGVFKNVQVFAKNQNPKSKIQTNFNFQNSNIKIIKQKFDLLNYHIKLWRERWGERARVEPLRRYFKIYVQGFVGASELREKMVRAKTFEEIDSLIKAINVG